MTARLTRRDLCLAAAGSVGFFGMKGLADAVLDVKHRLRVGILSDIHVTKPENANWFEKALRYFDSVKADAVMITGDLTTWSKFAEFETVANTWFRVFPGDRRSDGVRIERLFITGNHDVDGWAYGGARFKSVDEAKPTSFFFHRNEFWERLFHEKYEPVVVKEVKGYTFVLRNWMSILGTEATGHPLAVGFGDEASPLPEVLAGLGLRLRGKPFFYAQHEPMADTVNATWLVDGVQRKGKHTDALTRKLLERYSNCVAFSGHTHFSLTDEMSIWQGNFTAVNCSCARGYAFTRPGYENGFAIEDFNRQPPFEMERFDNASVRQGLVMDVFEDRIVFKRLDLTYGLSLGLDWEVPLFADGATVMPFGRPKYDFRRRASESRAPQFKPGSKVSVRFVKDGLRRMNDGKGPLDPTSSHGQIIVSFPPIVKDVSSPTRGFAFSVRCESREKDSVRILEERKVLSPNFAQSAERETEPSVCKFPCADFPSNRPLRFVVRAIDCWGNVGEPISTDWIERLDRLCLV